LSKSSPSRSSGAEVGIGVEGEIGGFGKIVVFKTFHAA
jgi:hypothetical protein